MAEKLNGIKDLPDHVEEPEELDQDSLNTSVEAQAENQKDSKKKRKRRRKKRSKSESKQQEKPKETEGEHRATPEGDAEKVSPPDETTPQQSEKGSRQGRGRRNSKRGSESSETPMTEGIPGHQTPKERKHLGGGANESPSSGLRQGRKKSTPQSQGNSANMHNSPARSTPRGKRLQHYEEYLTKEEVSHGLKRGDLLKGAIRISPRNFELAWVTVPDMKRDVMIEGRLKRNRALHGDVVALRLLPRECWKERRDEMENYQSESPRPSQTDKVRSARSISEGVAAMSLSPQQKNTPGQDAQSRTDPQHIPDEFLQKTACVVYIIEKKHSRVSGGHLKPFTKTHKQEGLFVPSDSRIPRLRIPRDSCPPEFFDRPQDFENTLFIARITSWDIAAPMDSFYAMGALSRSLGEAGEIEPETEAILLEYGIDSGPFPDEALACLPEGSPWEIPKEEFSYRRDFREDCVFTIDPLTARDLDDALHCKVLDDGNFEVGVHIADVSFFVRPDSALDLVARDRATSTYMVQKVIPMLPRGLCEELCSLNPGQDRLTFSIVWKMSERGDILDEWKGRGIIRSRVKMAYEHAQEMIEQPKKSWTVSELPTIHGDETAEELSTCVNRLQSIARRLRQKRIENGALRLNQVRLKFDLDKTTGCPIGYRASEIRDANSLIEEFMLLANMAAAHHIYKAFPDMALLRRHPKPHPKQLDDFLDLCKALSISFDGGSSKTIHDSLVRFEASSAEKLVLVSLIMKPMKNAQYFCSGSLEESMYGHYALSVPLYTHFTSPIRRYADIIVHRLLAASLEIDEPFRKTSEDVDVIAVNCNDRKLAAKTAGELSGEMFFGIFVRECGPLEKDGVVTAVMDQSFDVLVPTLGLTRRVFCKYCPGLKSHVFSKAEKKTPAELKLLWSVTDQMNGKIVEVEQSLRVFTKVGVIITSESQVEVNAKPFKFYFELVPPNPLEQVESGTNATTHYPRATACSGAEPSADTDRVCRKLFQSEPGGGGQCVNDTQCSITQVEGSDNLQGSNSDSDDVIVESDEDETT